MSHTLIKLTITQSELFSSWPAECLERLIGAADAIVVEPGTCVHRAADAADFLYLLASGSMTLMRDMPSGDSFAGGLHLPGEFHGLGPVISRKPHIHTAICKEETVLVRLPAQLLRQMLANDGRLFFPIFSAMERRHLRALNLYAGAVMHSTQARIAALLVSVCARSPSGSTMQVKLSQNEIASMLGTQRQVINRALKNMESEEVIRVEYGRIMILDTKKLAGMSQDIRDFG